MDSSVLEEIAGWLTKIAGAGITILPLIFLVGLVKSIQQLDNMVGNLVNKGKKASEGVGSNINNRRDANAAEGRGIWGGALGANRRRRMRKEYKAASLAGRAKHASEHYIADYIKENPDSNYAKAIAGGLPILEKLSGGQFGEANPQAIARALAGAQFTIEKAELEEVKAAHVRVDSEDEKGLNAVLANRNSSKYDKAAALERLVKISSAENLVKQINEHASGGEGDIVTKSLANALAHDGPGFLKGSDIDNIARGQIGRMTDPDGKAIPSKVEDLILNNMEKGVYSEKKIADATGDELGYVSNLATKQGATAALDTLKSSARALVDNPNLKGTVKHNRAAVEALAGKSINPDSTGGA